MTFGIARSQEDTLNRHWSAGKPGTFGTLMNAGISGCYDNFHGKVMHRISPVATTPASTSVSLTATGIDFQTETTAYQVWGASQMLGLRTSITAAAVTGAGFPQAAGTTDKGILRLTMTDVGTGVNGKASTAMTQENLLWISNAASFRAGYYIDDLTNRSLAKTISFAEIGVMGEQSTIANICDAAKEPADGNPFIAVKIASGRGTLRVRTAASATILESEAFEIPTSGGFNLQFEYNYVSTGSVTTLFLNGSRVAVVKGTVTGPLQRFARACHGANYIAATHVPTKFDIGESWVSLPYQG